MKFCPECGTKVEGMKFCPECGYDLTGANATSAPDPEPEEAADAEAVILTFQNKTLIGDASAKKNIVGNLDVKIPHKEYTLTNQRLIIEEHGVLNTSRDEIELYRVKDIQTKQKLIEKARNIGSITIVSSDASTPNYTMESIEDPWEVAETIRTAVRSAKEKMNISYRHNL